MNCGNDRHEDPNSSAVWFHALSWDREQYEENAPPIHPASTCLHSMMMTQ